MASLLLEGRDAQARAAATNAFLEIAADVSSRLSGKRKAAAKKAKKLRAKEARLTRKIKIKKTMAFIAQANAYMEVRKRWYYSRKQERLERRAEKLMGRKLDVADRLKQQQGIIAALDAALGLLQRGFQLCNGREPEPWQETDKRGAEFGKVFEDAVGLLRAAIAEWEKKLVKLEEGREATAAAKECHKLKRKELPSLRVFWKRQRKHHEKARITNELQE